MRVAVANSRIVEVLPEWKTTELGFFALYSKPETLPVRVRALIDFLAENLRPELSWAIE